MRLETLIDDFALFDRWEDKYRYLIDLGAKLAPLSDAEQTATNKVSGCVSQVWLVREEGEAGRLRFRGTSDAHIVRGLIMLLLAIYSNKCPQEILAIDAAPVFDRLGLEAHLSPQRSSGFYAMVERIKRYARESEKT